MNLHAFCTKIHILILESVKKGWHAGFAYTLGGFVQIKPGNLRVHIILTVHNILDTYFCHYKDNSNVHIHMLVERWV